MRITGSIDRCGPDLINGWIFSRDIPDHQFELEVIAGDQVVGKFRADRFRKDLFEGGIGDGKHAFSFAIPKFLPQSVLASVRLRVEGGNVFLLPSGTKNAEPEDRTVSAFGGLWIDRASWLDRLARKLAAGEIDEELSYRLFRFVRDGYVVIPGAVPMELVAAMNEEVEKIWQDPPPGLEMTTHDESGKFIKGPPDIQYRNGSTKLLDLYAYSATARACVDNGPTMKFLSAIFEDTPKAFQELTFWNGSQQAMHKDTAYVKIDSNPMALAATWLALEEVTPGSGELEYFVGSHRAPDFKFGGVSKWMEHHTAEHNRFLKSLHEDAEKYGHPKSSFLAKPGDVLIWHADLAHGGSPITAPGISRRSLVTHLTPDREQPFYRRTTQYAELRTPTCVFVSQFRDVL